MVNENTKLRKLLLDETYYEGITFYSVKKKFRSDDDIISGVRNTFILDASKITDDIDVNFNEISFEVEGLSPFSGKLSTYFKLKYHYTNSTQITFINLDKTENTSLKEKYLSMLKDIYDQFFKNLSSEDMLKVML